MKVTSLGFLLRKQAIRHEQVHAITFKSAAQSRLHAAAHAVRMLQEHGPAGVLGHRGAGVSKLRLSPCHLHIRTPDFSEVRPCGIWQQRTMVYVPYPGQPRLQARGPRVLALAPVQAVGAQPRAAVHEVEGCKHQRADCARSPTQKFTYTEIPAPAVVDSRSRGAIS